MSIFKDKSDFNIKSAELLLKNQYFAPSVHCSYYGCIQYMLYILFDKQKKSENEFEEERRRRGTGTHAYAISLIKDQLFKERYSSDAYKTFQKLIPELKEIREKSDYKAVVIEHGMGFEAFGKAESITRLLTTAIK